MFTIDFSCNASKLATGIGGIQICTEATDDDILRIHVVRAPTSNVYGCTRDCATGVALALRCEYWD